MGALRLRALILGLLVVADGRHVGHVGGDGLDLAHELVPDATVVLRRFIGQFHPKLLNFNFFIVQALLVTVTSFGVSENPITVTVLDPKKDLIIMKIIV